MAWPDSYRLTDELGSGSQIAGRYGRAVVAMLKVQFDGSSTASDVLHGTDLSGKFAVVTGGGGGLGRETARALAAAGANVAIAGRSLAALERTRNEFAHIHPQGSFYAVPVDLSSVSSVDGFADAISTLRRPIDIFIGNAGIMATPLTRNAAGHEMQFATNFIGHAVLLSRLAARLRESGAARVVTLSSSAHHYSPISFQDPNWENRPYDKWLAYGQSKTACALLAVKVGLAMKCGGVTALAVHPGVIATDLARYLSPDDYAALMQRKDVPQPATRQRKTVEQGAATSVWAATAPELAGKIEYLEDCAVAKRVLKPDTVSGVMGYALDAKLADELWSLTERLLGRKMPL
jgi:NAD(P)-dependent dehydrogenase (short-subunit alcohol dehydrogenase family)